MSEDGYSATIDPRTVAIDDALHEIEHELHRHLRPVERIAITRALERLGEQWAWHGRRVEPW